LRGRVPWYVAPPKLESDDAPLEGREGALGEKNVGIKRKREEAEEIEEGFEGFEAGDGDSIAASDDSLLDEVKRKILMWIMKTIDDKRGYGKFIHS